jgi:hemoglobin
VNSLYEELGGELVLRNLTKAFYKRMQELPDSVGILKMHGNDLSIPEEKLFLFLSGWAGGPPLFEEKYGHPRLRARHLPFQIGKSERDQWMMCMVHAVDDVQIVEPIRSEFLNALLRLADHMRNQPEV